jgi:hypothetical protein
VQHGATEHPQRCDELLGEPLRLGRRSAVDRHPQARAIGPTCGDALGQLAYEQARGHRTDRHPRIVPGGRWDRTQTRTSIMELWSVI